MILKIRFQFDTWPEYTREILNSDLKINYSIYPCIQKCLVFLVKFLCVLLFSLQQTTLVIDEEMADGPVILRKRRAAQPEKNTCQLFIQTDHLFFKYYGTREAVIAQVHLKHRCLYGKWCLLCFILHIYRVVLLGYADFQSREGH